MPKILITACVATILVTQFIVSVTLLHKLGWPIIPYPMYALSREDGDRVLHDVAIYARFADDTRIKLEPEILGFEHFFLYRVNIVTPVMKGLEKRLPFVADLACGLHDAELVSLEAEDLGIAIGRNGAYKVVPETLAARPASCNRGETS